jgi:hypothetical protein
MTNRRHNYLFKDMELQQKRETFTDESTIGTLSIEGKFECFILEDKDRGLNDNLTLEQILKVKVYGKTAIPYGRYEVDWTMSARFKVMMPILLNVKGYSGIRIHKGNTEIDSLGCLLCGTRKKNNMVTESTLATKNLYAKIENAKKQGQRIFITIVR